MNSLFAAVLLALAVPGHALKQATAPGAALPRMIAFIKANKARQTVRRRAPVKNFAFSEKEVNDYASRWIAESQRAARRKELVIKSAEIRFKPDHLVDLDAVAHLDGSALKQLEGLGDSYFARKFKELISVDNSVHLECALSASDGKGQLDVRQARLSGLPVPSSLIREVLILVGRAQHPRLDFDGPIPLPNGIETVEILPKSLKISVRPQ